MQSRAERVWKQLMHYVMLFTKSIYHFLDKKELLIEACLKLATLQVKMYAYCTYLKVHKREKFFVSDFEFFTIL
jgi:hypothetical protein